MFIFFCNYFSEGPSAFPLNTTKSGNLEPFDIIVKIILILNLSQLKVLT
jgi:hypothetical protein